ncbi:MAG: hypothetical protein WA003_14715, partial [Desulfuromonadaceae bacterium]
MEAVPAVELTHPNVDEQSLVTHQYGRDVALELCQRFDDETYQRPEDPRDPAFAAGVIAGYHGYLSNISKSIAGRQLRASLQAAKQLARDPWHGLLEFVQNADDQRATTVTLSLVAAPDGHELWLVHDGKPVEYQHVAAMVLPFVSTKDSDSSAIGRFGIGMKTLWRLGRHMEVHCLPYHFQVERLIIQPALVPPATEWYRPESDTLVRLRLNPTHDPEEFATWVRERSAQVLTFLRHVTNLVLRPLGAPAVTLNLTVVQGFEDDGILAEECSLSDGQTFTRWSTRVTYSGDLERADKAIAGAGRLAIATTAKESGLLFIALPTASRTGFPCHLDAEFDPGTSRERVVVNELNSWLMDRLADFTVTLFGRLLQTNQTMAWQLVPLVASVPLVDFDEQPRYSEFVENVQSGLLSLELPGLGVMSSLAWADPELDPLLEPEDYQTLLGHAALPAAFRQGERAQAALRELGLPQVTLAQAVLLAERPETSERELSWLARLLELVLVREPALAAEAPLIRLEDGRRQALVAIHAARQILVFDAGPPELVRLEMVQKLDPCYRTLSQWPALKVNLGPWNVMEHADPTLLLELLARSPRTLTDDELRFVKRALELQADPHSIGLRLGKMLLVEAFRYQKCGKKEFLVAPAGECYLPPTIAKDHHGYFAEAAARTPGLTWIQPNYGVRLKGSARGTRRRGSDAEGSARQFLQLLGAATTPRVLSMPAYSAAQDNSGRAWPAHAIKVDQDWQSPDLVAVLNDLARAKVTERRRRALALLRSLAREWLRFEPVASAAVSCQLKRNLTEIRNVSAQWLEQLRQTSWLPNTSRGFNRPVELVVFSEVNKRLFLPPQAFIDLPPEATGRMVAALGITTTPETNELCRQLAIAATNNNRATGQAIVIELARRVQAKRGSVRSAFVTAQASLPHQDGWFNPGELLLGRPIFGRYRRFVSENSRLKALWKELRIEEPGLGDAVAVIRELAERPLDLADAGVYLFCCQLIARELKEVEPSDLVNYPELAELPLWGGARWYRRRPIYYVNAPSLRQALAGALRLWQAPLAAETRMNLLEALRVRTIPTARLVPDRIDEVVALHEAVEVRFRRALQLFGERLRRNREETWSALSILWSELLTIPLGLLPGLTVTVSLPDGTSVATALHAHVSLSPVTLIVDSEAVLADGDETGRALAQLFKPEAAEDVQMTWAYAWQRALAATAGPGQYLGDISLLEEPADSTVEDDLTGELLLGKESRRSRLEVAAQASTTAAVTTPPPAPLPPLELKDLSYLKTLSVTTTLGKKAAPPNHDIKPKHRLKPELPVPRPPRASAARPCAFTPAQKEDHGYAVLEHLLHDPG